MGPLFRSSPIILSFFTVQGIRVIMSYYIPTDPELEAQEKARTVGHVSFLS
jgi:hypothetical protein